MRNKLKNIQNGKGMLKTKYKIETPTFFRGIDCKGNYHTYKWGVAIRTAIKACNEMSMLNIYKI